MLYLIFCFVFLASFVLLLLPLFFFPPLLSFVLACLILVLIDWFFSFFRFTHIRVPNPHGFTRQNKNTAAAVIQFIQFSLIILQLSLVQDILPPLRSLTKKTHNNKSFLKPGSSFSLSSNQKKSASVEDLLVNRTTKPEILSHSRQSLSFSGGTLNHAGLQGQWSCSWM